MNPFDIRKQFDVRSDESLSNRFRERRFAHFVSLIEPIPRPIRIVDIGGTVEYWRKRGWDAIESMDITIINLKVEKPDHGIIRVEQGDALDLKKIPDKSFDIAYSNSVIEHVYTFENQKRMAAEVQRIAKYHWIQTPNYWFPIEPHFHLPGWQWMPRRWRIALLMNYRCGWRGPISDRKVAENLVDEVRLLRLNDMGILFPNSVLWEEKIFGLTKSIVAHNIC